MSILLHSVDPRVLEYLLRARSGPVRELALRRAAAERRPQMDLSLI